QRAGGKGRVIGEHRFVGLFTSAAYSTRVSEVPLVRGKVRQVIERAGHAPASHLGKALVHILETYPRDGLFQITVDELAEMATGILRLGERQRFRLFVRRDAFDRFVSCLIFVPREYYTTELRRKFQQILLEAFDGSAAEFDVLLTDAVLAQIHITVRPPPGHIPPYDRAAIEKRLAAAARRWEDDLRDALNNTEEEARAAPLFKSFGTAFPGSYRAAVGAERGVEDIQRLDRLSPGALSLSLQRPSDGAANRLVFKVYHGGTPGPVSGSFPMLEDKGGGGVAGGPQ